MLSDKTIDRHRLVDEELAQRIFNAIASTLASVHGRPLQPGEVFEMANATSRDIQQALADHYVEKLWEKLPHRRPNNVTTA